MILSAGCLTAAATAAGLAYLLLILPTQWIRIERVQWPSRLGKTILHISDLHLERMRVSPGRLAAIIRREQPDAIALTGDFMDRAVAFPKLERILAVFRDAGCPCFAVLGNHDYQLASVRVQWMARLFALHGVRLLRNESVVWDGINVVGIDDFCTYHDDEERAFARAQAGLPTLVLTHDPNIVPVLVHPFDSLLSGHLHGKQFNVPFLFALQPMGVLPTRGIYRGLHASAMGPYYISKGIGQSGVNARFLVRSEIAVHRI